MSDSHCLPFGWLCDPQAGEGSFTSVMGFLSAHTGNPKGVMLTHGNVVADFSGFLKVTDVSDCLFFCPENLSISPPHITPELVMIQLQHLTLLSVCFILFGHICNISLWSSDSFLPSLSCRKSFSPTKMIASFPSCHWLTCLRDLLR